jgi:hypothetical protein
MRRAASRSSFGSGFCLNTADWASLTILRKRFRRVWRNLTMLTCPSWSLPYYETALAVSSDYPGGQADDHAKTIWFRQWFPGWRYPACLHQRPRKIAPDGFDMGLLGGSGLRKLSSLTALASPGCSYMICVADFSILL